MDLDGREHSQTRGRALCHRARHRAIDVLTARSISSAKYFGYRLAA
jgi:hypothetical protein